jgi:hypothetical protein
MDRTQHSRSRWEKSAALSSVRPFVRSCAQQLAPARHHLHQHHHARRSKIANPDPLLLPSLVKPREPRTATAGGETQSPHRHPAGRSTPPPASPTRGPPHGDAGRRRRVPRAVRRDGAPSPARRSGQGFSPRPPAPPPARPQALRRRAQQGGPRVPPAAFPREPAGSAARARLPRATLARAHTDSSTDADHRAGRRSGGTRTGTPRYAARPQITRIVYTSLRVCPIHAQFPPIFSLTNIP